MINNTIKYFNNDVALDNISVTEIEELIKEVPSASIYQLLLAKKMNDIHGQSILLGNQDRVMMHYVMEQDNHIPNLTDLTIEPNPVNPNAETYSDDLMENIEMEGTEEVQHRVMDDASDLEDTVMYPKVQTEHQEINQALSDVAIQPEMINGVDGNSENNEGSKKKNKKRKGNKKFKLNEYSGISEFSKWLLSFKEDNIEDQIKKEEKAAKKRALEESAKRSVTKTPSIISESLAEILANQGHLDDAKKMYEQLILKYPEKSSYFAGKINLLIKT